MKNCRECLSVGEALADRQDACEAFEAGDHYAREDCRCRAKPDVPRGRSADYIDGYEHGLGGLRQG
jgi:hypothetical protein